MVFWPLARTPFFLTEGPVKVCYYIVILVDSSIDGKVPDRGIALRLGLIALRYVLRVIDRICRMLLQKLIESNRVAYSASWMALVRTEGEALGSKRGMETLVRTRRRNYALARGLTIYELRILLTILSETADFSRLSVGRRPSRD